MIRYGNEITAEEYILERPNEKTGAGMDQWFFCE